MRRFGLVAVLMLVPGLARAECTCTCVGGKAVPVCAPPALVEPICQRICTESLTRTLGPSTLSSGSSVDSLETGSSSGVSSGQAGALRALIGR